MLLRSLRRPPPARADLSIEPRPPIAPALDSQPSRGLLRITLRPGRVVVRGKTPSRDKKSILRADYVLFYKTSIPLAVIEAKDNSHTTGAGMAQGINYAELLGVPFAFASNGDGFVFRVATLATGTLETNLGLAQFPTPQRCGNDCVRERVGRPKCATSSSSPTRPARPRATTNSTPSTVLSRPSLAANNG